MAGDGPLERSRNRRWADQPPLRAFLAQSTFHGLKSAPTSGSKCSTLIWAVILLVILGSFAVHLRSLILTYLSKPSLTSKSMEFPADGLLFPPITLCPLAKFNHTRVKERSPKMTESMLDFVSSSFTSAYSTSLMDLRHFGPPDIWPALQDQLNKTLEGQRVEEWVSSVSFDCEPQFLWCWFANGKLRRCCEEGPVHLRPILLHSGPCWVVQVSKRQEIPGPVGGLGIAIWHPSAHLHHSTFNGFEETGVRLYTSPTNAMLEKEPRLLSLGSHAHLSLEAVRMERQDSTCHSGKLAHFQGYSANLCQVDCMLRETLARCGCVGLNSEASNVSICTPLQALQCFKKFAPDFPSAISACRLHECPADCDSWSHPGSLSHAPVLNPLYPEMREKMRRYWKLPSEPTDISEALILLDVYFSDINYVHITQMRALSVESFVSNIGGCMGLWLGASVITWVHLAFCLLAACRRGLTNKANPPPSPRIRLSPLLPPRTKSLS